jgi:hypothetical protein
MINNTVWLEVDTSNQAILSYFLEQPATPSSKCDYVEATNDELVYLSALEDFIYAPGTVATLSDLEAHRARVQAAKKTKPTVPTGAASNGPQQPVSTPSKPSNANRKTNNPNAKQRFIATLKKHRPRKLILS